MKYNKIILLGMMGAGKSVVSKILSKKISLSLFEADDIFEEKFSIKINDYFSKFGENNFRKEETVILKSILNKPEFILSSGGGVILNKQNRNLIFNNIDILTIYLKTSANIIYERIKSDNTRPLLNKDNSILNIEKIINERKKYYELSKCIINTDLKNPNQIAEEIIDNYEF